MRSCLLALCFDSTTLFEIAVFLFRFLIFPTTSSLTGKNAGSGDEIFIPICFREFFCGICTGVSQVCFLTLYETECLWKGSDPT